MCTQPKCLVRPSGTPFWSVPQRGRRREIVGQVRAQALCWRKAESRQSHARMEGRPRHWGHLEVTAAEFWILGEAQVLFPEKGPGLRNAA